MEHLEDLLQINSVENLSYQRIFARFGFDQLTKKWSEQGNLIAKPEKAILDLIYKNSKLKEVKELKDFLIEDKRIEEECLRRLDGMMARYTSYETLCEIIRHRFQSPKETLEELFLRLVFNILCGNTDDHARNHAAFWDGNALTLIS